MKLDLLSESVLLEVHPGLLSSIQAIQKGLSDEIKKAVPGFVSVPINDIKDVRLHGGGRGWEVGEFNGSVVVQQTMGDLWLIRPGGQTVNYNDLQKLIAAVAELADNGAMKKFTQSVARALQVGYLVQDKVFFGDGSRSLASDIIQSLKLDKLIATNKLTTDNHVAGRTYSLTIVGAPETHDSIWKAWELVNSTPMPDIRMPDGEVVAAIAAYVLDRLATRYAINLGAKQSPLTAGIDDIDELGTDIEGSYVIYQDKILKHGAFTRGWDKKFTAIGPGEEVTWWPPEVIIALRKSLKSHATAFTTLRNLLATNGNVLR